MTMTRALILSVVAATLGLGGCGSSREIEPASGETSQSVTALDSRLIWQVNVDEPPYPCSDQCWPRTDCGCLPNQCGGGIVAGQPCSTLGAECNTFAPNDTQSYELECAPAPVTPPPTQTLRWVADPEIEQCLDLCGFSGGCACIRGLCAGGDVTDQPCTTQGASCKVVSRGDSWTVRCKLQ